MQCYEKFADVYDQLMRHMPYDDWVHFVTTAWNRYGIPRTVVELGCGTGCITTRLALCGYRMVGIDISSNMLAIARHKTDECSQTRLLYERGQLQWIQQDMTQWTYTTPVHSVISFCDVINYLLDEQDVRSTFERTFERLEVGGTFIFDVHHSNTFVTYAQQQPFVLDEPSISYIWTCQLDDIRSQIQHDLTVFVREDDDEKSEHFQRFHETHHQRAYDVQWVRDQLLAVGFQTVEYYGDFTWEKPTEQAQRIFYIAVKGNTV